MTKMQIIKKLSEVDDDILAFIASKPKIDPYHLKKKELEELLVAFETMDRLFRKMQINKAESED